MRVTRQKTVPKNHGSVDQEAQHRDRPKPVQPSSLRRCSGRSRKTGYWCFDWRCGRFRRHRLLIPWPRGPHPDQGIWLASPASISAVEHGTQRSPRRLVDGLLPPAAIAMYTRRTQRLDRKIVACGMLANRTIRIANDERRPRWSETLRLEHHR